MNYLTNKRTLFIGLGFELQLIMQYALRQNLIQANLIAFTRRDTAKAKLQAEEFGITYFSDNTQAINIWKPDVIFVGVKPTDLATVIPQLLAADSRYCKHLIFITAALPFTEISTKFSSSLISNVIPDDHIDENNPNNFVVYTSTANADPAIEEIFIPTCNKLVKVAANDMIVMTTLGCQGNPILNLLMIRYSQTAQTLPFDKFVMNVFVSLRDSLKNQNSKFDDTSIGEQLAKGYVAVCSTSPTSKQLFLELLSMTFDGMVHKNSYYTLPAAELQKTIENWATVGGYEERGIEIVKETYTANDNEYLVRLPELLFKEMNLRGDNILNYNKTLLDDKHGK